MPARAQYVWFLIFIALLGVRGFELARDVEHRRAEAELEPRPREFFFAGTDLVLDSALLWLDRGSVDEALLVAASTPLAPGQEIDLLLSFDAADAHLAPRGTNFGGVGSGRSRRVSARNTFAESRHLPADWERPQVQLHVTGSHAAQVEELHALALSLGYDARLYGPSGGGRHAGSEDANVLLPTGGVAAIRKYDGNYLLLLGIRPHDEPFEPNRIAAWRTRILQTLELATPSEVAVAETLAAIPPDGRLRGWHRADPILELAVAGAALADAELCDLAALELAGPVADLRARVARSRTVPEAFERLRERGEDPREMTTLAALAACGAMPFVDLAEEPAASWLVGQESPLRMIAVAEDPALLAAVVDPHVESRLGNHLHRYMSGALAHPTLGRTEAARAEWDRLRAEWLGRGGWSMRLIGRGGAAAAVGVFLPWLLALALVLLPSRRTPSEPRLSRAAVLGLLLASALTLGDLELLVFAAPLWWWLGRRWLASGRRPLFDRILVLLLVGATGEVLGHRLGVTAIRGGVDWTAAAQVLGCFFLGRVFLAQERVWDVRAWTVVLAILVLSRPAHDAGLPGPILFIAILVAMAIFFLGSRGGPALRALPA